MRRTTICCALLAASVAARADDEATDEDASSFPKFGGDVRAGWRLVSGEGEGRFPQDVGLKDGPRVFDLHVFGDDPRSSSVFDHMEARASGVGDPWSDYLIDLRRSGTLDLSGGYRRDDTNYRASGDFFPYDTVRERGFAHAKWTPDSTTSIRLAWDRDLRRGDAFTRGHHLGADLADAEHPEDVGQVRPLFSRRDTFTGAADWSIGIFRFGLTQSVALSDVEQDWSFDVPPARANGVVQRGEFDNDVDATTSTSVAKVGVSLFERTLDATLFVTHTRIALSSDLTDFERLDDTPAVRSISQDADIDRRGWDERLELAWRPWTDWEFTGAAEYEAILDDVDRSVSGTTVQVPEFSVDDRNRRFSLDATWQATPDVRLRAGEQFLRETLFVPTDRPLVFLPPDANLGRFLRGSIPREFESDAWRTTGGVEWKPIPRLTTGLLAHWTTDSDQQAVVTPHVSRDFSLRTRWQADEALSFASQWRHVDAENRFGAAYRFPADEAALAIHDRFLSGHSRSDAVTTTGTWASGDWTATGSATWRNLATSADSAHFEGPTTIYETEDFREHETIANVDLRWDATCTLHLHTGLTRTVAHGDLTARWLTATAGVAHDLHKDLTLGVDVFAWRLDDEDAPDDSYRTLGVEFSATYRF